MRLNSGGGGGMTSAPIQLMAVILKTQIPLRPMQQITIPSCRESLSEVQNNNECTCIYPIRVYQTYLNVTKLFKNLVQTLQLSPNCAPEGLGGGGGGTVRGSDNSHTSGLQHEEDNLTTYLAYQETPTRHALH